MCFPFSTCGSLDDAERGGTLASRSSSRTGYYPKLGQNAQLLGRLPFLRARGASNQTEKEEAQFSMIDPASSCSQATRPPRTGLGDTDLSHDDHGCILTSSSRMFPEELDKR